MNTSAVVMMLVAMVVLWGGLVLAIISLSRTSREETGSAHRDL